MDWAKIDNGKRLGQLVVGKQANRTQSLMICYSDLVCGVSDLETEVKYYIAQKPPFGSTGDRRPIKKACAVKLGRVPC